VKFIIRNEEAQAEAQSEHSGEGIRKKRHQKSKKPSAMPGG
jgi:hypothetical protein